MWWNILELIYNNLYGINLWNGNIWLYVILFEINNMGNSFDVEFLYITLSTPKMRFSKTLTCKGKFYEILTIPHQFAHIGDYAFKYAWNHESNYLIIFPLCAFYQEYYNLWNSNNRWISNLKVALTMFLKMIPPVVSNYYLKIFLDQIVIETYLYINMNCFLVSLCVSGFVYH